jgi:hypothetical protein
VSFGERTGSFGGKDDIKALLVAVERVGEGYGEQQEVGRTLTSTSVGEIRREDLRLICFDLVMGG